jgi:hypothetical protein
MHREKAQGAYTHTYDESVRGSYLLNDDGVSVFREVLLSFDISREEGMFDGTFSGPTRQWEIVWI